MKVLNILIYDSKQYQNQKMFEFLILFNRFKMFYSIKLNNNWFKLEKLHIQSELKVKSIFFLTDFNRNYWKTLSTNKQMKRVNQLLYQICNRSSIDWTHLLREHHIQSNPQKMKYLNE